MFRVDSPGQTRLAHHPDESLSGFCLPIKLVWAALFSLATLFMQAPVATASLPRSALPQVRHTGPAPMPAYPAQREAS